VIEIYCVDGCGRPAARKRPLGVMSDGSLVSEWVCERCAEGREPIMRVVKDGETGMTKRRDPGGVMLAVVFIVLGIYLTVRMGPSLWWLLSVPLIMLGVVGFWDDITPHERDSSGRRIDN
jgi:hypothetical protein